MQRLDENSLDLGQFIRAGDHVVCGQGTAEPLTLSEAVLAQAGDIGRFSMFVGVGFARTFREDAPEAISFASYGAIGTTSILSRQGRLAIEPLGYHALTDAFASGRRRADVVLLQLSRDGDGRFNMGLAWDYTIEAARNARTVIAEVMADLPLSSNGALPADICIDAMLESGRPPCAPAPAELSDTAASIGRTVAGLIPDGATLQTGVGSLPDAILRALEGHRRLGLHSGVASDGIARLVECGAMDNASKPFDAGVCVCGSLFGGEKLRRFADRNPAMRLESALYTHRFENIAAMPDMIAINSILEVDLLGQVNSETANGVYIGAIGGQPDFAAGAMAAKGGRSILTLGATAAGGKTSRVVPRVAKLSAGADMADVFVTEWGAAEVRGVRGKERARRIIAIAAPQFRDGLERAFLKMESVDD